MIIPIWKRACANMSSHQRPRLPFSRYCGGTRLILKRELRCFGSSEPILKPLSPSRKKPPTGYPMSAMCAMWSRRSFDQRHPWGILPKTPLFSEPGRYKFEFFVFREPVNLEILVIQREYFLEAFGFSQNDQRSICYIHW